MASPFPVKCARVIAERSGIEWEIESKDDYCGSRAASAITHAQASAWADATLRAMFAALNPTMS